MSLRDSFSHASREGSCARKLNRPHRRAFCSQTNSQLLTEKCITALQIDLDTGLWGNVTEYFGSIEKSTLNNSFFRRILFTGKYEQLVLMCLQKGEDIGEEIHEDTDQFFRIEEGEARFVVDGREHIARSGDAAVVPAGARHNVINNSNEKPARLYTIYSPPHHPDGTVDQTKADAEKREAAV